MCPHALCPSSDSILNDPTKESTIWGNLADPDGDLVVNIFENYHNSHPGQNDALHAAITPKVITPQNKYTFEWKRAKNNASGSPVYQWSMDLVTWYDSGTGPSGDSRTFNITVDADNGTEQVVTGSIDKGSENILFMRLKIP